MAKVNLKFISRRPRSFSPGASLRKTAEVPIKIKLLLKLILHLTEEDPDTGDVCTLGRWKLGLCDGKLTYLSYQHQDPIHNSLIIYANDEQMIQILSGRLCLQGADALGTAKITGNCQIRNIFPCLIKIFNREINNPSQII
ncbi:unnamed protein product [Oikopleura dioica]|uniref:SCP2 domain-containing protein n=1 Tax=Oikopleura dioica TaxID=34765 RepID=E4YN15_OIKDI|nr:unnamed protein product [Oikopleura dioica]